ncbi:hypothetical protein [Allobranchiibius sp. CTAmp26]|uniref:hypothetical protein n=1 Tax=Allobranchiibius sp. CTAmp26 TaxID=2815214 RepID=UPI001AA0E36E|nr:hypothetical protein [Allobranchiibius sp. CTAmp26]MBO1754831.1 hypothetical protein [Allobranchiibius sp. CTAmp26]
MTGVGFIRAYGLHWAWDEVHHRELWGKRGRSIATHRLTNFWEQTGIYVLHDPWGAYYVGQVAEQMIGERLTQHSRPKLSSGKDNPHYKKWTHFSWFGFHALLLPRQPTGITLVKEKRPEALLANIGNTINDVEALLMMTLGTTRVGNKHSEKFTSAEQWDQVTLHELPAAMELAKRQAVEVKSGVRRWPAASSGPL